MKLASKSIFLLSLVLLLAVVVVIGSRLFAQTNERKSSKSKVEVVTVGLPQTSSFAEAYAQAAQFGGAYGSGRAFLNQGEYKKAIEQYNNALSFAQSPVEKAMAYSKLALCYEKLGDIQNQIKYLELDSQATLSEKDRKQTLQQISKLRSQLSSQTKGEQARQGTIEELTS